MKKTIILFLFFWAITTIKGDGYDIIANENARKKFMENFSKAKLLDSADNKNFILYKLNLKSKYDALLKGNKLLWMRESTGNEIVSAFPTYNRYGLFYLTESNSCFLACFSYHNIKTLKNRFWILEIPAKQTKPIYYGDQKNIKDYSIFDFYCKPNFNLDKIVIYQTSDHLFIPFTSVINDVNEHNNVFSGFIYNLQTKSIKQIFDPFQFLYPFYPESFSYSMLVQRSKKHTSKTNSKLKAFPSIKVNGVEILNQNQIIQYYNSFNISISQINKTGTEPLWMIYRLILSYQSKGILSRLTENAVLTEQDIEKIIDQFCNKNHIKLTDMVIFSKKIIPEKLIHEIKNNNNIKFKLMVSQWIEKNHRNYSEIKVNESEIAKFYKNYKWAFMKELKQNPSYYKQNEVRKDIIKEIKRIKYYRLDELLENPPEVEFEWNISETNSVEQKKCNQKHPPKNETKKLKETLFTSDELNKLSLSVNSSGKFKNAYEEASFYDRYGEYLKAADAYKQAAKEDNPFALYCLGEYYLNGRKGVEKNQAEAEQCFQKAIGIIEKMKKPSPEMLWVGGRCIKNMFPKSYRSRKNARKAFLMFKQATDQNYPAAQCDLGECYFQGYSVRQSTKTGINMIKMAAAKGCARAQALEASYYLSGGKGSDISKALKLLKSSIQKNDAVGEYCLGLAYEKGIGLEKNIEKSRYWLQKSADQGYDKAQLKLQK